MEKEINIEYRKLVASILKTATKIAIDHRKGPANFVRVPHSLLEMFPDREIAGIPVYLDSDLENSIIVGRIDSDFIAEEKITI
jgi:hypothetical protein